MAKRRGPKATPAEAKYRRILREHEQGKSLATLARHHGVKRSTLVWWKWQIGSRDRKRKGARSGRSREATPKLVPVQLDLEITAAKTKAAGFEVLLRSGRVVRVPSGFDADELRRLVPVLEESEC